MVPRAWVGSLVPGALPTSPLQSATTNSVPKQMSSVFSSPHSRRQASDDQRPPGHNVEDPAFPAAARATTGPGSSCAKVRPLPPPPETSPRTLRETPGPRNRTKPADGGGGRRGSQRTAGMENSPRGLKVQTGLSSTPQHPATSGRGNLGLCPAPPGGPREVPARFLRWLLPAIRSPKPSVPLAPFPPLWRKPPSQEPRQLRCPRQTQKHRSQAVSQKPPARTASGLRAQEAERGEAPRCRGDALGRGRGGPTTMTALRPVLALLISPRIAQRSLFQ